MMRLLYTLLLLITLGSLPRPAFAQEAAPLGPGHLALQAEALHDGNTLVLGEEPWRYHAGDDLAWANPTLDDAGWRLLPPDFDPDSLAEGVWTGIGWFRLHLHVDSLLRNTTLALHFFHLGASEVYLDGEKVGGYGVIGRSAEEEQPFSPKGFPIGLHLNDQAEHVLAVRYAYRSRMAYTARLLHAQERHAEGFFLLVNPINAGFRSFFYKTLEVPFVMGLIVGIFVLLGGLHLLLYSFDRRERANLYFSILAFSGALTIYIMGAYDSAGLIIPQIGKWLWVGQITQGVMVLSILAIYYQVFYRRLVVGFWIFVGIALLVFVLSFWTHWLVLGVLFPLILLEGIRVTVLAIRKKKAGAWILGAGMGLLLADVVAFFALADQFFAFGRADLLSGVETVRLLPYDYGIIILVFYVCMPITMSVLLAHRFSRTSRRLQGELDKVQALSAQTLAQEREKQALIASQNERLEAEVAERTSELRESLDTLKTTQAQLVQQEKMASLGQLTAGIAHEIKNPLNFINNFAEVNEELAQELREASTRGETLDDLLDDLEQNAQVIAQHGKRADAIVRAMMQHASGGAGRREPTDLNALVTEYIDLAYHGKRAQVHDLKVNVERTLDETIGEVEIVPQDIGRVLLNLLGNAFDAVHEHAARVNGQYAPTVTISTQRIARPSPSADAVEIHVSDNGPGIHKDFRGKIFEPFFTTKPAGTGTGLGLSLSYDIVTQGHGGALTVESEPGRGATFTVTLPLTS